MDKEDKVAVVIVTYANRWGLLNTVLKELIIHSNIAKIVIVDNGSCYDIVSKVKALNAKIIDVIQLNHNTGSANGYYVGLSYVYSNVSCQYIWMLDDDNLPDHHALDQLISYYRYIRKETAGEIALLSLRKDRLEYVRAALNGNIDKIFPSKNSFLGFHLKDLRKKIINKIREKTVALMENNRLENEYVVVPVAPYGGLFFPKYIIDKVGFPNRDFFLYSDDHDYTARMTKSGIKIYLIPSSKITDLEKSWNREKTGSSLIMLLKSTSDIRVYYSTRNRVYFEHEYMINNKLIYILNKYFYIMALFIYAISINRIYRFKLIYRAIKNGENGVLGQSEIFT